ncbi:glycine-rich domain-containing protein [Rhizobium sp. SSA_523]|uniref:glycine-rich domain-containing protein n=1 Tax=Rhizobium sp. SSA_523 TaxID=2952477 RepID=UPI00339D6261
MSNLSDLFPSSGAQIIDQQTFTASGTWIKPAGVLPSDTVIVDLWGGGGSGALRTALNSDALGAGSGAGGAHNRLQCLAFELQSTEAVIVGAGGAAQSTTGTSNSLNGADGGMSSFKGRKAYGGGGGSMVSPDNTGYAASGGGIYSAGQGGYINASSKAGGQPLITLPNTNNIQSSFEDTSIVFWAPGEWGGGCSYSGYAAEFNLPVHGGAAALIYSNTDRRFRSSVWGGGAGGSCSGAVTNLALLGGLSSFGGNGGDAVLIPSNTANVNGNDGQPRGGGGSGAKRGATAGTVTSGAGGRGEVVITIIRR